MDLCTKLALETWKASGERSDRRLDELVAHYCGSYGYDAEKTEGCREQAFDSVAHLIVANAR